MMDSTPLTATLGDAAVSGRPGVGRHRRHITDRASPAVVHDTLSHGNADESACAAALVELEGMTPRRLIRILDGLRPTVAWAALASGTHPADRARRFRVDVASHDPQATGRRYRAADVSVLRPRRPGYPPSLDGDLDAPAVLTALGSPAVLEGRPVVAVVGTSAATPYGGRVAAELGHDLASVGVVVVSSLDVGVDGAALAGALRAANAPPVAVVEAGLACPSPRQNVMLWNQVADVGAILSEAALAQTPGTRPPHRRSRIIAGLADVVVVVECHARESPLLIAEAAAQHSVPVGAVPGSVHSRASAGTNALLADGCAPVRDATDVLVALGLARAARGQISAGQPDNCLRPRVDICEPSDPIERSVWAAVDANPTDVETVMVRTGLSLGAARAAAERLVDQGRLMSGVGWWSRE